MVAALMLMPVTMLLAPQASTCPRTTCPRHQEPLLLVDVLNPAIDALTPTVDNIAPTLAIMGGIAQYSPKGFDPLDVARDFLGPIMFSINNDPLWQSAMLVGMVGATVYQIRALNRITATQIGDRSLKAVTVVSTSRLLSLGTQETKAETETEQDPLAISAKDDTFPVCCSPLLPPPLRRARLSRRGVHHPDQSLPRLPLQS